MRLIDADALITAAQQEGAYGYVSAKEIADAPTIEAEPKWIRCEERLPQKGQVVLVTNSKGNVRCGQFRCTDMEYWVWKGNTLETVTAWMPLPKPYMATDEAPAGDVAPVRHGRWEPYEFGDDTWHKCSVCGTADKYINIVVRKGFADVRLVSKRNYCPICGAKMDEEEP